MDAGLTTADQDAHGDAPEPVRLQLGDSTPRLTRGQERVVRGVALITLAYTLYYLIWRWTETLNPDALWFSVPLAAAETYGFLTSLMMVFTVWKLRYRQPVPPPPDRSVDVFITTYDEPLDLVRRTAVGARDIRYPHRTYILDDGKRDEIRAMAEELGIDYIRREGNEHAKAGNLNNALRETDGEFILQLDADHVPLPYILDRLLGFFDDPKVAFVQSPQDFYNTDSFTHNVNDQGRRMWEEQRIFFSLIQPGKDNWNAAFFCGSCGVIRRSAIDSIGGFSVQTITEDMETSLILHAQGWKSVYYGESLAYGLAPGSAGAFHVQRLRWGQGSMQILRKLNPLFYPGLSLPQRICYFSSVTSYLDGVQNMLLYLAPLVFFFTGAFPIRAEDSEFLARFIPYLVLQLVMFELLARGTGFLWISARYNMAKFFTYVLAVSGFFARGKLKFNVTPKGVGHVPFKTYAPQLTLMVISIVALLWAVGAEQLGLIDYEVPGWGTLAFWLNLVWVLINFGLAWTVVRMSLLLQQQRNDHRFADVIPIRVQIQGENGESSRSEAAVTENLNGNGVAFRSATPLEPETRVRIALPLSTGDVEVTGEVLHRTAVDSSHMPMFLHGVRFEDLSLQDRDAIESHCINHAVPVWQLQYRTVIDVFERASLWLGNARREIRQQVRLPAQVEVGAGEETRKYYGLLDEISPEGARLLLDEPVTPGSHIHFRVAGLELDGEGVATFSTGLETAVGVRYSVGVYRGRANRQKLDRGGLGRRTLQWMERQLVP